MALQGSITGLQTWEDKKKNSWLQNGMNLLQVLIIYCTLKLPILWRNLRMNKEEYFEKLTKLLKEMPKDEREDILSDYEEHFRIGMENGRTEEELSRALGDPKQLQNRLKLNTKLRRRKMNLQQTV